MLAFIIRNIIALAILYGVYTETGPWTTLLCFLFLVSSEATTLALKRKA